MQLQSAPCKSAARRLSRHVAVACLLAAATLAGQATAQTITAPVVSSRIVPLSGQAATRGEPVNLSGTARVRTTVVPDQDWRATPVVIVTIEFLKVAAVGVRGGGRFTVEQTLQKLRPLAATDTVDVSFPVVAQGSSRAAELATALVGQAVFTLSFDTRTGALTAASGSLGATPY